MSREDSIQKLKNAIDSKRKELGLKEEDTEQYRWLIDILKQKTRQANKPAPKPEVKPQKVSPQPKPETQSDSKPPPKPTKRLDIKA